MALKVEIKGVVSHTSQPQQLKSGKFVQEIVVTKPAGTDEFGDRVGKDQHYPIKIFKDNREDFQRAEILKKKCKATCYLNGREFTTQEGLGWAIQLNLKTLEVI